MEESKLLNKKRKVIADGDSLALAAICTDLAIFYVKEERYNLAISEYKTVEKIYENNKMSIEYASINRGIGEAYMFLSEYKQSLQYLRVYLDVAKKLENKLEEQRALATLGNMYMNKYQVLKDDLNDVRMAQYYFRKSLGICENLSNISKYEKADMLSRLYCNMGTVEECLDKSDMAMEYYKKAIALCKAHDVYKTLQRSYFLSGALLDKQKKYNESIQHFNIAVETAKKLKDNILEACSALCGRADVFLKLGNLSAAKNSLHKAYKLKLPHIEASEVTKKLKIVVFLSKTERDFIAKNTTDENEIQEFYETMGDGYSELNVYEKALEYYKKMLEMALITKKNLKACYYSLAVTCKDMGDYETAITYFEKEYRLCQNLGDKLNTLCEIADTKEAASLMSNEIIKIYDEAIEICHGEYNRKEERRVYTRLISYLKRVGKHKEALQYEAQIEDYESEEETESNGDDHEESLKKYDISLDDITEDSDSDGEKETRKRKSRRSEIKRNFKGETALHTACIKGQFMVVKQLLDIGHPVNIRDNSGWLPLHDACISGHCDIVELLLERGASINDRGGKYCNGTTPLHDACVNGHLAVIELLLNKGASVLAKTDEGETPYHYLKKEIDRSTLTDSETELCNKLLTRMASVLEKTGENLEIKRDVESSAFVTKTSPKKNLSPKKNSLRHIVDESSDEEKTCLTKREQPKTKATNEYQQVMNNLRKKSYDEVSNKSNNSKRKSVFTDNSDDDWLDNDLKEYRNKKKKRLSNSMSLTSPTKSSPRKRLNSVESTSSRSSVASVYPKTPDKKIWSNTNSPHIPRSSSFIDPDDQDVQMLTPPGKNKIQPSLYDMGFKNSPNKKTNTIKKNLLQPKITHFGSTSPIKSGFDDDSVLAMDVDIEGRRFMVTTTMSLRNELTIKWLAEEAARKYAKKTQVEPVLELFTKNGSELVDDDTIGTLFFTNSHLVDLKAKVLKWKVPPIKERYQEACSSLEVEPSPLICERLEAMVISLDLRNESLTSKIMAPFCKSLLHETKLLELDLTNNYLSTSCVKLLCSSLPTLENLTKLNLCCTHLKIDSLRLIANTIHNQPTPILGRLQCVNFSENFLIDQSLPDLAMMTQDLNLKEFYISHLNFTDKLFDRNENIKFNFDSLESLDISSNNLTNEAIIKFISSTRCLNILNISENRTSLDLIKRIIDTTEGSKLKMENLNLSGCKVDDTDVYNLLQSSLKLTNLNLANTNITSISLRRLLQSSLCKDLILYKCESMDKHFDPNETGWILENYEVFDRPKSLKITCDPEMHGRLISLWTEKYCDKVVYQIDGRYLEIKCR